MKDIIRKIADNFNNFEQLVRYLLVFASGLLMAGAILETDPIAKGGLWIITAITLMAFALSYEKVFAWVENHFGEDA